MRKLLVAYTDDEYAGIVAAANRADLSPTAYVGSAALAAAVGMEAPGAPLQEAMTELMQARTAVNRIGGAVNKLAAKALAGGDVSTAELQAAAHGLVKYLYGEGRRNEHTDAHMIASWDGNPASMEPELVAGRHDVGPLVRLLEQPVRVCDRAPAEWVYHLVLRNAPGDRPLSDDEWADVCTAAMDRTGIAPDGDLAGCRWVAVRHADDHICVVAPWLGRTGEHRTCGGTTPS